MFVLYSVLGGLLYVIGDVLGKYWAIKDEPWYFVLGLALYSLGGIFMFLAIKEDSLTMALLVMPPIAISTSLLAGRFLFDEKISPLQYAAAGVILVSIIILLWNPKI